MGAPRNDEARWQAGNVAQQTEHGSQYGPTDALLSRLEGVKRTGNGPWRARCPAHGSKSLSLAIREADMGATLLHCFAGCPAHEVVGAVGLEITDLFPPRPDDPAHVGKPERRPFPAADILRAVAFEASIVALVDAGTGNDKTMAIGKQRGRNERDDRHRGD